MRLHDFLDYHAREQPGVEFAVQGPQRLTYREAGQAANRLANALIAADEAVMLSRSPAVLEAA